MSLRMACVGFRHGHVTSVYQTAKELDYIEIVAAVEEDVEARAAFVEPMGVEITHETMDEMMGDVDFDLLSCVDYYGKRGSIVIQALEAGKHVITDKPMCTKRDELQRIRQLCRQNGLEVQIALTMRYGAAYQSMVRIVRDGGIGEFCTGIILGQHPLAYGSRPMWYFEEGKQGGTINDLFIHGTDMIGWTTGLGFAKVIAAEAWNARADWAPFFQDSAQVVYELSNGSKLMGDCSYLAPEQAHAPWQFYLWGTEGHVHLCGQELVWQRAGEGDMPVEIKAETEFGSPLEDFASHLEKGTERWLSMEDCFKAQMASLAGQEAADSGRRDMGVPEI